MQKIGMDIEDLKTTINQLTRLTLIEHLTIAEYTLFSSAQRTIPGHKTQ